MTTNWTLNICIIFLAAVAVVCSIGLIQGW
jgi:hypothetical protein